MPDIAHKMTEAEIEALERKIKKEYDQALRDAERKASAYFDKFEEQDLKQLQKLKAGEITVSEYKTWRTNKMLQGKNYNALVNRLAADLSNADKIAMKMVGDALPGVYALNSNFAAYDMCRNTGANLSFDVYDRKTVERLIKDEPELLPAPRVDIPKDLQWNKQHIRSALTQGVLQGESINKIAKRLRNVTDMDRRAAVRNARTAMTGAQNAGRYVRYKEAEEKMGLVFDKVWIATHDARTRDSHLDIDGTQVPRDEEFPNGLMYPGDPEGEPGEVYNCRCTMKSVYMGKRSEVQNAYGKFEDNGFDEYIESNGNLYRKTNTIAEGKDISATWQRRPDKFDFEIEDVMNAQGFDGLPRIVRKEEFDEYVKQANGGNGFIAQRTYSAKDLEELTDFKNQLYNDKWYVDCSVGGAQYGQGMYCAADYNGQLSNGIKVEMETYKNGTIGRYYSEMSDENKAKVLKVRNEMMEIDDIKYGDAPKIFMTNFPELVEEKAGISVPRNTVETLTLDPSAKIITYDELNKRWSQAYDYYAKAEIDKLQGYTREEMYYIADRINVKEYDSELAKKAVEWYNDKDNQDRVKEIDEMIVGIKKDAREYNEHVRSTYEDLGSFAVSMGYDAINAENHGKSGSYTVILNRTKLIILGEE
jgi:SPP1 gp7 family putative phage head morphogenesis protein